MIGSMALIAYLDDSREYWNGLGFHAFAGYIAPAEFWDTTFAPRWKRILDGAPLPISEWKSSDCGALKGEYKGWTREQAHALTVQVVDEIVAHPYATMFGFGCVVLIPQFGDDRTAKQIEEVSLMVCIANILGAVCKFAALSGKPAPIQFVCDQQPDIEGRLRDLWNRAVARVNAEAWGGVQLSNLDFKDSRKVLPIQAADLLAYETRKDLKNRIQRPEYPMSRVIERLQRGHPHIALYMDGEMLADMFRHSEDGWRGFGLLYNSAPFSLFTPSGPLVEVEDPRPVRPIDSLSGR